MIEKQDVARTLKRLRQGRTQAYCAREAGISPNAWSHYEKGRRMPTTPTLPKLAKGVGVTLAKFEESLLESRSERLREEAAKMMSAESSRQAREGDPFKLAVLEGLENIRKEVDRLSLLADPKHPRS